MAGLAPELAARVDEVKRRLSLTAVMEGHVKLSGSASSRNRRGKCPFHGSNSASLSVQTEAGFAHCFGCGWNGDVVRFVRDIMGLDFIGALRECEARAGISEHVGATASGYTSAGVGAGANAAGRGPVQRERSPTARRERVAIEPIDMARWLWRHAAPDVAAVRRYFMGRGVPAHALTDQRLRVFRYLEQCPCWPWRAGEEPRAGSNGRGMMMAPAIMAVVSRPVAPEHEGEPTRWEPAGLHVTYLNPEGTGTMKRRAPWAEPGHPDPFLPKRRMLGPVGNGAIILGRYRPDAHLFVGEGNETVLSAIGLADGPSENIVGVAALSLDNLQGAAKKWRGGIWPLHAIEPDPERGPFTIPGHRGAVTGLIDSDMAPLRGMRDLQSGEFQGEKLVERKGGPIIQRAITGAERASICADLMVKGWRKAGAHPVGALRAPVGMDFNDAAAAMAAAGGGKANG